MPKTKAHNFISKEQIQSVLDLKQKDAAASLSVSLASLKRYFQKFFPGQRWPRTPRERIKQRSYRKRAELNFKLQSAVDYMDHIYFNLPKLPLQHNSLLNEPPQIDDESPSPFHNNTTPTTTQSNFSDDQASLGIADSHYSDDYTPQVDVLTGVPKTDTSSGSSKQRHPSQMLQHTFNSSDFSTPSTSTDGRNTSNSTNQNNPLHSTTTTSSSTSFHNHSPINHQNSGSTNIHQNGLNSTQSSMNMLSSHGPSFNFPSNSFPNGSNMNGYPWPQLSNTNVSSPAGMNKFSAQPAPQAQNGSVEQLMAQLQQHQSSMLQQQHQQNGNTFGSNSNAPSINFPQSNASSGDMNSFPPAEPDPQFIDYVKQTYSDPKEVAKAINDLLMKNASLQQEYQKQTDQITHLQQEIFCHQNDDPAAYVQLSSFFGSMTNFPGPWQAECYILASTHVGFVIDRYYNLMACTAKFHEVTGFSEAECYKGVNLMQTFMRIFSCRHYINLLNQFCKSAIETVEFNETCKRKDGRLIHLRVLLKRSDEEVPRIWGWVKEIDHFLEYILVDGHYKIDCRVIKKETSKYTEDDALVSHMLMNRLLGDTVRSSTSSMR